MQSLENSSYMFIDSEIKSVLFPNNKRKLECNENDGFIDLFRIYEKHTFKFSFNDNKKTVSLINTRNLSSPGLFLKRQIQKTNGHSFSAVAELQSMMATFSTWDEEITGFTLVDPQDLEHNPEYREKFESAKRILEKANEILGNMKKGSVLCQ